jgi:signal transduction histidine kinase
MKLLRRTLNNYILFSTLLLLICSPLSYFFIQRLFVEEMEEELFHHKKNFLETVDYIETDDDLKIYQLLNEEFQISQAARWPVADSLFSYQAYDSAGREVIPFRALRTGVTIQNKNYQLIIRESIVGTRDLIQAIVTIQVALLILLLIGFILINQNLSKKIWQPFYNILEKLKRYQIDSDTEIKLAPSDTSEFEDLRMTIEQLVEKNRSAYLNQKEFTENASHELQTPLAVFRSKLELLMQTNGISNEQADLISDLFNANDRIARLNKNLLLLSKIENNQFQSKQQVPLKEAIEKTCELYKEKSQTRKIKVVLIEEFKTYVDANPTLLDIMLSNLISNALRHAPKNSEIEIRISEKSLLIKNPGQRLENPEKLFLRFSRESRTPHGHGLGLAIVKEICEAEGFEIIYTYTNQHCFQVKF